MIRTDSPALMFPPYRGVPLTVKLGPANVYTPSRVQAFRKMLCRLGVHVSTM